MGPYVKLEIEPSYPMMRVLSVYKTGFNLKEREEMMLFSQAHKFSKQVYDAITSNMNY